MRKLVYSMLTSLDLYVEGPDGKFGWATPNPELHRHFNAQAATRTTHVYGRRMWGTMSAFWPTAESDPTGTPESHEFARYWNAGEHLVFSRSLESVAHGARLVREDALEVVRRLKSGEGSELEVSGPNLAATFIKAGLVDEIGVYINPIAVGGGKQFFAALDGPLELRFLGMQTFEGGVIHRRYAVQTQPHALAD